MVIGEEHTGFSMMVENLMFLPNILSNVLHKGSFYTERNLTF